MRSGFLKASLASLLAAFSQAAFPSDINVSNRPATYASEKQAMLEALRQEPALQAQYHRDENVRKIFPETQCMTVDGDTGGPKVRETLQIMREEDTLTGPLLRHFMTANDAWYCERPLSRIKGNLWGLTYDFYGIVAINEAKPLYRLIGVAAHETLHLMQKARGLSEIEPAGDIYSLQSRFLANEAAAHALEVAYAFELAQAGDTRAWEGLQTPLIYPDGHSTSSPYLGLQSAFSGAYAETVRSGASHAHALVAGGKAAVTAFVTTEQEKLDIYNEIVLQVYLSRIGSGLTGAGETTWTPEKTKLAGKLTENFSLTQDFVLPEPAARFGKNEEMRWAFEAAELYRKKVSGDTAAYTALREKAAAGGNPYLDIDMAAALDRMPGAAFAASPVRTVSVFNLLSGRAKPKLPKPKTPGAGA
ncbi:MAG: hypothetical protein EPN97_04025 [Alphaproteobacteria bacterium]|nr:MAG: hypothetical protein EPN97_04025 [Alphaproteobacteria bacterium]